MTPKTPVWLAVAAALAAAALPSGAPAAAGVGTRGLTDGILRVALPRGWSGSVGLGTQVVAGRPRRVAWIWAGDFSFPGGLGGDARGRAAGTAGEGVDRARGLRADR